MTEQLLDASWYRAEKLRPRLRPHVEIHRHYYRGQRWYVIQDNGSGRFHRFTPLAYQIIGMMDGVRTLGRIWTLAAESLGDDVPTQGETLRLLHQLHAADVLQTDVPADAEERQRRFDQDRRRRLWQQVKSPLAVRLPLLDPERFLSNTAGFVRPVFSWLGLLLWFLVVSVSGVLAVMHWPELVEDASGKLLAPQNLVLIWLVFPVVKALHELGHAYAVKRWGGEVHQIGIMFLVFMPVPYVDASAATAFRDRYRRALVGAAGMLVEVFLAGLAMFVWLVVEPGLVKAVAYNVMIIAGVSTVLFNGNPLLRFDAYYILADLVEIPNLAQRSNRYVFYLIQRHLFRVKHIESPVSGPGEKGWFLFYAPASFAYRMFIFFAIIVFVGGQFFFIGILIAIWASFNLFILPMLKGAKYLTTNPALLNRRGRAWLVSTGFVIGLLAMIFLIPVPLATVSEGVMWTPEGTQVRADASGFINTVHASPDDRVNAGDLIVALEDPMLEPELAVLQGELATLEAGYDLVRREDRVRAAVLLEQIEGINVRIDRKREQLQDLNITAPVEGRLVLPRARDLSRRFVNQGALLGYVVEDRAGIVRAVVTQDEIDLVRNRTLDVTVRPTQELGIRIPAHIIREVPSASLMLPSAALGTAGGGRIAVDPRDPNPQTSLYKVFQFDLELDEATGPDVIGSRVHVRFDHGYEPIGWTWYRALRRLFLRHFDV